MAYEYLNETTYTRQLQMQQELLNQILASQTDDDVPLDDLVPIIEAGIQSELEPKEPTDDPEEEALDESPEDDSMDETDMELMSYMMGDDTPSQPRIWHDDQPMQYGGKPKKKYQVGGEVDSYYTNNPKDPRIKAYRDSLDLYDSNFRLETLRRIVPKSYSKVNQTELKTWPSNIKPIEAYQFDINKANTVNDYSYIPNRDSKGNVIEGEAKSIQSYKKPVQPVIYDPITSTQVQGIGTPVLRGSIPERGYRPANIQQQPTKYSLTTRDEDSPSKQRSTYFNSLNQWRAAVKSPYVNVTDTQETSDRASATGYMRQFGGTLYATDENTKRIGLNNPTYNQAILRLQGSNTIRGLDNYQPVAVTDGSKYKILKGPNDTARFNGTVYEKRLNSK